jgi:hypothetical protein
MADVFFQNELNKINNLIPKLERFSDLNLADIPEIYKKEIASIKIVPQFTSGGVESMVSVLNTLYFAKYMVEAELKPASQSLPQTPDVNKNPTTEKPMDIVKTQSTLTKETTPAPKIIPKPVTNPTQPPPCQNYPSPSKVEEKYKKENPLDFGPYSK